MIEITSNSPTLMWVNRSDSYGGKTFNLSLNHELVEMLDWYRAHKEQMLRESRAREKFESVASAYEQYQTTLKLVLDQT
jgi:hypothetical protein